MQHVCAACVCSMCVQHVCAACVCSMCVQHVCAACVCSMCVQHVCAACVCSMCVQHVCAACVCSMCVRMYSFLNELTACSFDKGRVPAKIPGVGGVKKRSASVEDTLDRSVGEEEDGGTLEEGVEVSKWAVVRGLQ